MTEVELLEGLSLLGITETDLDEYLNLPPNPLCCKKCDKRLTQIEDALEIVAGESFTWKGKTIKACDCPKCRERRTRFHH